MKAMLEKAELSKLASVADITKAHGFGGSPYVRLTADGSKLLAFANDGLIQATVSSEADCSEGDLCVGGGAFARAVASLPAGRVELIAEEGALRIRCGRSRYTLPTANPEAVGLAPIEAKFEATAEIQGSEFLALMRQLAPMVGKAGGSGPSASNAALRGLHFKITPEGLECAATDSYRIGVRSVEATVSVDNRAGESAASVPVPGLQLLAKAVTSDDVVTVELSETAARFSMGEMVVHSRVMDGAFPPYPKFILPLEDGIQTLIAEKADLVETLTRTGLFTTGFTPARAELGPIVTFSAREKDAGESEQELESAEFSGEERTVWVNPHLLLDAIKACDGGKVRITGFGETKNLLRLENAEAGPYVALVMLVRAPTSRAA